MEPLPIDALAAEDFDAFAAHFARHRAESGRDGPHFMPFAPDDPRGPRGLDPEMLGRPVGTEGWQRAWVVRDGASGVVGHVNLKGAPLRTAGHRCELGAGLEAPWRGAGLGRRLMETAIAFARAEPALAWIDLATFAHNAPARALYRSLGFETVGVVRDAFRIAGTTVDDVRMVLDVRAAGPAAPRRGRPSG
jgi:RimJ/RimL family protein N-acetyltransferase